MRFLLLLSLCLPSTAPAQDAMPVSVWLRLPAAPDAAAAAKVQETERRLSILLGPAITKEVNAPGQDPTISVHFRFAGWSASVTPENRAGLLSVLEAAWGKDLRIEEEGSLKGSPTLFNRPGPLPDPRRDLISPEALLGGFSRQLQEGNFPKLFDGAAEGLNRDSVAGAIPSASPSSMPGTAHLTLGTPPAPQTATATTPKASNPYEDDIQAAAKLTGVDADMLRAVAAAKSGFKANRVSGNGYGLMGLAPNTLRALGYNRQDILDPRVNLEAGARVMASLLREFDGDVSRALAAYQVGPAAVLRSGGIPNNQNVKDFLAAYERASRGGGTTKPPVVAVVPPTAGNLRRQVKDKVQDEFFALESTCRRSGTITCWEPMIRKLGEQAGLDDTGVLLYESMLMKENPRGNPAAVSPKGAVGLAQLMPDTAKMLRVKDPTDPRQNLLGGARHLKDMLDRYDDDPVLAAAAYNAGEGYVKTMVPRFAETIAYVRSVFKNFLALGGNPVDVEHYIPPPKPRRRARKPAKPDSMQAVAPH